MEVFTTNDVDRLYSNLLSAVIINGHPRETRGTRSLELHPVMITLTNPLANKVSHPLRKLNTAYRAAEFLWIHTGRADTEWIGRYNSQVVVYADQHDGRSFFGAYGPHWKFRRQQIVNTLREDPGSRQAVVTFWQNHLPDNGTRDVPCTVGLMFLINDGKLDLTVMMRSNDIWLGFPYDVYTFTMLQNWVAAQLDIPLGTYYHLANSLHIYSVDLERAHALIEYKGIWDGSDSLPLEFEVVDSSLLRIETEMRNGKHDLVMYLKPGWADVFVPIQEFWRKRVTSVSG